MLESIKNWECKVNNLLSFKRICFELFFCKFYFIVCRNKEYARLQKNIQILLFLFLNLNYFDLDFISLCKLKYFSSFYSYLLFTCYLDVSVWLFIWPFLKCAKKKIITKKWILKEEYWEKFRKIYWKQEESEKEIWNVWDKKRARKSNAYL